MKVIFFGTPEFAKEILKALIDASIDIVAVVTKPEQPQGRNKRVMPSSVQEFAMKALPQVPIYQPENCRDRTFIDTLALLRADVFVVVAYGEILHQEVLDLPKYGCINLHASLLPQYRGAAPIHHALLHGDQETGVSIIQMVRKMDAGDILGKVVVSIDENMQFEALEKELCSKGAHCLLQVLKCIENGSIQREQQAPEAVTFAPKITIDMAAIDWKKGYRDVHNQVRAFSKKPGAFTQVVLRNTSLRVKILETTIYAKEIQGSPGVILYPTKKRLVVYCGDGAVEVLRLQLPGKPVIEASQFLQGYYDQISIVDEE